MKNFVTWILVVSLLAGGGVILNRSLKKFKNWDSIGSKSGTQKPMGTQAKEDNGVAAHEDDEGDAGNERVTKINDLVDSSIASDGDSIQKLNDRIAELQKTIGSLTNSRRNHEVRLVKLQRIKEVLESKKVSLDIDREVRGLSAEDLAKYSKEDDAVKKVNEFFKRDVAKLSRGYEDSTLSFDGQALLIIDDKPVRVSKDNATVFAPLIAGFKDTKTIENAVIRASKSVPLANVRVLNEYLGRVYNVSALFVQTTDDESSRFPIEVEIQGVRSSLKSASRNLDGEGVQLSRKKRQKAD